MINYLTILLISLSFMSSAQNQNEALRARDDAIKALGGFNPRTILKDYTSNPAESSLQPKEGGNNLNSRALSALKNNQAAKDIYQNAGIRAKVRPNPKSHEMVYAESLLVNPDKIMQGNCYKIPGECSNQIITKKCIDVVNYERFSCKETLEVQMEMKTQSLYRVLLANSKPFASFDLRICGKNEYCTSSSILSIMPNCEKLEVAVTAYNESLPVIKKPTCSDPTVTVQYERGPLLPLYITVTEFETTDHWLGDNCAELKSKNSKAQCLLEESQSCIEHDKAKEINGITIKRPCWGKDEIYQCANI